MEDNLSIFLALADRDAAIFGKDEGSSAIRSFDDKELFGQAHMRCCRISCGCRSPLARLLRLLNHDLIGKAGQEGCWFRFRSDALGPRPGCPSELELRVTNLKGF